MRVRELVTWLVVAAAAIALVAVLLPRAYPLFPRGWRIHDDEARAIALEHARSLGPIAERSLVSVASSADGTLERHLLIAGADARRALAGSPLLDAVFAWRVTIFPPGAAQGEWSYRVHVSALTGRVIGIERQLPKDAAAGELALPVAIARGRALLAAAGFDLARYGAPEPRAEQQAKRTDLVLRFPAREQRLGASFRYGVEVRFLGDQPGGWGVYDEEVGEKTGDKLISTQLLLIFAIQGVCFLVLIVGAVVFGRKYHAGEVGVQRGSQILLVTIIGGVLFEVLYMVPLADGVSIGAASRQVTTWAILLIRLVFGILPIGLIGMIAWCVGESWARERWGRRLAGFDALFKGDWRNATVARDALRGITLGVLLLASMLALAVLVQRWDAYPLASFFFDIGFGGAGWLGVAIVGRIATDLPLLLLSCLFFNMAAAQWLRPRSAAWVAAIAAMATTVPLYVPLPVAYGLPVWFLSAGVPVLLFWWTDLLTALFCAIVAQAVPACLPLILAADHNLQLQGWIPLLVLALPLLVSIRQLHGGEEFVYRWEDVPPHVRRIAERERQRVEIETARQIQSSILPELPPQLNGVALAHAYLPASEVGGDFYDVLALDDGRVAVAVGDVAGHGVSSGLVMSMVRSALAVQVTFDPEVESVFATLNRMVFQSARRRLLTTLTYALVDPQRRELVYASAGHVFPYRITGDRRVLELDAGSYPLGVRAEARPPVHQERLAAGDFLVLLSDGVPEACREGSDEPFGFHRLAESLARHAGGSPEALVRGVLADLDAYTRHAPREDDVTLLALRLPA